MHKHRIINNLVLYLDCGAKQPYFGWAPYTRATAEEMNSGGVENEVENIGGEGS